MTVSASAVEELRKAGLTVRQQVPLSTLGSFQLGGPASAVVLARSPDDLRTLRQLLRSSGTPALLIGEGTNILFSDQGWPGLLVRCAEAVCDPVPLPGGQLRVNAAMNLERLVDGVIRHRLSGLECFVGIPGTVGGAVAGNAGAWGVQLADRLVSVSGWTPEGDPFTFSVEDCGFEYRDSRLKREGHWISEITLQLTDGDPEKLHGEKTRILAERAARHPDWRTTPCIGSFFKNLAPTSSAGRRQAAGWFLEEAGAKDCRVGGAAVFDRHANILIKASENCRSRDVADLAQLLQTKVREVHGIELQREVRFLGDLPGYESYPGFW